MDNPEKLATLGTQNAGRNKQNEKREKRDTEN
jgi:hypothetical protein